MLLCCHTLLRIDGIQAASKFSEIREEDPFCLDAMDVYSNVLYVQINRP